MKVAITKCNDYNEENVYSAITKSIDLIGGIGFIKKNSKVLVKPNILTYQEPDKAVTTHPAVIDAVCKILYEKGAKIIIGESSGVGNNTKENFEKYGMDRYKEKYGAQIVPFETRLLTNVKFEKENAKVLDELNITSVIDEVDFIINLPKLKTHMLTKYTGAVKNMYGVIPGGGKGKLHVMGKSRERFCHILLDVYSKVKPNLSIMDGIIGLEGNGPGSGGIPIKTGVIIGSYDAVALDIVGSRMIGYDPMEIHTNRLAFDRGVVGFSVEDIELIGDGKDVRMNYQKPKTAEFSMPDFVANLYFKAFTVRPKINRKICVNCKICQNGCPAKAIDVPNIDYSRCILCYCCHEVCPHHAIDLKKSTIGEVASKLKDKIYGRNRISHRGNS